MADKTKDLGADVLRMGQHLDQRLGRVEAGQARLSADVADVRADILDLRADHGGRLDRIEGEVRDVKADVAALRADHGGRLDRIENDVRDLKDGQCRIIDVMNENFGRLFVLLKKDEGAAE